MKNIKNISTTKRNNRGLFFQLTVFTLLSIMSLIGANTTQTFAQTCTPSPPGMVRWFPGDGNARDISPGGNNNGFQGTQTAFAAGKVAQAFQFNGNGNSRIDVPDSPSLRPMNAITIDAWINPAPGNGGLPSIVFKGNIKKIFL